MSSFVVNRSSDAECATGIQLCTMSIVEQKERPPQQFSEHTGTVNALPGFTPGLKASPTGTRLAGINIRSSESPQDIAHEPTATANFNKMFSIHFQRSIHRF
ncbi:hypothetical protein B0H19DRAFT_1064176 [Mycena capillaripes]|nr:hypothetical protein B0H19DRAFT_1064176 [Mycena capillaripes]